MVSFPSEASRTSRPTWNPSNEEPIRHKLSTSGVVIRTVVSKKYIALSLDDRTIHVFSSVDGEALTVFRDNSQNAWSLALQDDLLVSGEIGGAIRVWDLRER